MKVLLLKPCWNYPVDKSDSTYNRIWPPLDLLNCAAFLRMRGHEVTVVDASARRLLPEEVGPLCRDFDRVFITSSSLDRWQCPNINLDAFLRTSSAILPYQQQLFIMGTHGSVRPQEMLNLTKAKAVIRGEPEGAVVDLAEDRDLSSIAGISFYDSNGFHSTPARALLDMHQFPMPVFEFLDYDHYFYEVMGRRFALVETSRGCPFSCMFCVKFMYGEGYRTKTFQQVAREIDYLAEVIKVQSVYFIDLEFTIDRSLVKAICRHLIERGKPFRWCCQTRADTVDAELLSWMKAAGCDIIHFGVESGAESVTQTLGKEISIRDVEQGVQLTKKAGIKTVCFFMFGLPGETLKEMHQTIRFAKQLNPTYASFHVALPYPGTRFYEIVKDHVGDCLFPTVYSGTTPTKAIERMVRHAFFVYYLRPSYLIERIRTEGISSMVQQAVFFMRYFWSRWWGR